MQSLAATALVAGISFVTFDGLAFAMCDGVIFLLAGCVGALWRISHERVLETPPLAPRVGVA